MSTRDAYLRTLLAGCVVLQSLAPSVAPADPILGRLGRLVHEATYHGHEPATCEVGAIEDLAENIDWLEHHIDRYGSIVAKQPDIWGEARLTKHRDEYERVLFRKLGGFEYRLNAAIAQSDSSFLAQALALSAAASPGATQVGTNGPAAVQTVNSTSVNATTVNPDPFTVPQAATVFGKLEIAGADKIALEPTIELDQLSRYVQHLHELRRINEGDDTSDSPGYSMNLVRIPVSILPGKLTREGFGAEITVTATPALSDDLMPTTFRNLAINDVVDMLGLPITRTTEALINGQFSLTLATRSLIDLRPKLLAALGGADEGDGANRAAIVNAIGSLIENESARNALIEAITYGELLYAADEPALIESTTGDANFVVPEAPQTIRVLAANESSVLRDFQMSVASISNATSPAESQPFAASEAGDDSLGFIATLRQLRESLETKDSNAAATYLIRLHTEYIDVPELLLAVTWDAVEILEGNKLSESGVASPTGRMRRAQNPLSPTKLTSVIGIYNLIKISEDFEPSYFGRHNRWKGGRKGGISNCDEQRVDLLDVRRFLEAETDAAYNLLSTPEHAHLFEEFASPNSGLARQIQGLHLEEHSATGLDVAGLRHQFFYGLHNHPLRQEQGSGISACRVGQAPEVIPTPESSGPLTDEAKSCVEALAWAIVVEAALLNERLNQDIRKLAKAKEVYELNTQRDYYFFLPDTVNAPNSGLEDLQAEFEMATDVFQQYVRARWPIHVFAIDPREQDQNVADISMRKRELQFALAVGFVTGQIGGNSLTQYSRDLQTQIETVSLNRTAVGFGHGSDTFGWRFQPRVQALEVPGTLGALRETLCGPSRDYDLHHRQLEPGMRECVAVVLMPSFVPYADFDVRTNWYKLTNPKNSALTMKDTVRLSRAITAMRQTKAQCSQCQHLYRDGEVDRMMTRVEQLDRELPLQSMRALVPYENTLGGFEMFNTGVTDLSPELIGWYGSPGIVINDKGTNCYKCGCTATCAAGGVAPLTKTCKDGTTIVTETIPLPICEGEGTTVFLVGDNFSVHDTKVIAGGVCIPHVQLVSREIMRVTIPSCVNTVHLCENNKNCCYVAVYLATPYGVTNHLHIPVSTRSLPCECPPTPAPAGGSPAPAASGCTECDYDVNAEGWPVVPASVNELRPTGLRRLPVMPVVDEEVIHSELGKALIELKKLQESMQAQLTALQSRPVHAWEDSVVHVQVQPSEPIEHKWCDHDHPLLGQMKTQTMECWRNLRDQLPCY
jgi:hypothetical protein